MKGQSLGEVYFFGLSGHPPNETLLTCVWLLWITPVVCLHRAGNEPDRKTCSNRNTETMDECGDRGDITPSLWYCTYTIHDYEDWEYLDLEIM